jgi:phosphate transport system permease protein
MAIPSYVPPRPVPGGSVLAAGGHGGRRPAPRRDSVSSWRWRHRLAYAAAWSAGLALCLIAVAILGYMAVEGVQYLSLDMLISRPQPSLDQAKTGGILDPIIGTVILTVMAIWIIEYGQPRWLARTIESGIEVVAGTPDIVLAIFGLAIFQLPLFAPLSFTADGGGVFGRSFFAAAAMLSLIAIPMVFGATREGLLQVPAHVREASWALGKTKICTIRSVLLPVVRRHIATGSTLGMGRIVGDTAIVVVLLGGSAQITPVGGVPVLDVLKGSGSTLTTYVYAASPAGEGNAPQKAYAAAFVLLVLVLLLNAAATSIGKRSSPLEASA